MIKLYRREQEILDALHTTPEGMTVKQIAQAIGRSETVVRKWIFYLGPEREKLVDIDTSKRPAIYKHWRFRAG